MIEPTLPLGLRQTALGVDLRQKALVERPPRSRTRWRGQLDRVVLGVQRVRANAAQLGPLRRCECQWACPTNPLGGTSETRPLSRTWAMLPRCGTATGGASPAGP